MINLPIYLDHNATTPCDPRVVEAMLPYFSEKFGNAASRNHSFGWQAEEAVKIAREQVAKLIGAIPEEIVFTSGATEGDNLAIKGIAEAYAGRGNHIITCAIEHHAVLDTCQHLEKLGKEVTYLPVQASGRIDPGELEAAIRPDTILIAVMYANNEVGTIMPVADVASIARKHKVLFFSDATQAVGKIPVDIREVAPDVLAFSAHKMYGPKGVGALYVRRRDPRVKITAQLDGGGHERGVRSGTLNVPAIVGFGKACEIASDEMSEEMKRVSKLRDRLENGLLSIPDTEVNGDRVHRLPHVTNISFHGTQSETLISAINKSIAVSSGSACSSASMEPSYVLKALGLNDAAAFSSIRFGLGRSTTSEEIDFVIEEITKAAKALRELSPADDTHWR